MGKPFARPILVDVHPDAEPPTYEILFLAELDSDHRVAHIPFRKLPAMETTAFPHAYGEFSRPSTEDLLKARASSALIDRTKI